MTAPHLRRALLGLFGFAACAPFGANATKGTGDAGASEAGASADASTTEAGAKDAGAGPNPLCPNEAEPVLCENFESAAYQRGWEMTPTKYLVRSLGADLVQHSVGHVSMATDHPGSSAEDFLGKNVAVESNSRRAVGVKMMIQIGELAAEQIIEVMSLDTGKFVVHFNLRKADSGNEVFLETSQFNTNDTDVNTKSISTFTGAGWFPVAIELRIGGSEANEYTASVGATKVVVAILPPYDYVTTSGVYVGAGLTYVDKWHGTFNYDIDDIVITSGPR